jgi:transposase
MHVNKVTVALAAKLARIAWVILTKPGALPGALYERRDPAAA